MNKIVIPTGYMGSGSSAVTDLLSEIDGYNSVNGNFEYVFMHCPNGMFDLEDKLLIGNTAVRSDEAIHSFEKCMRDLFCKKHFWVGEYNKKIGEKFEQYYREFVDSIVDAKFSETYWYYQEWPTVRGYFYKAITKMLKILLLHKVVFKPPLQYKGMLVAYPQKEEFYKNARIFLNKIYTELGIEKSNLVLDQFLLPHNLYRLDRYFSDNCKAIVVDRDPRDVFLLNKYFWDKMACSIPYPTDVEQFCVCYRKMRNCETPSENENILRIHFEDLVYNYESTVNSIFAFLDIKSEAHTEKKTKLKPEKSALNTQLFNRDENFVNEAKYIEKELKEFIYDFPIVSNEKLEKREIIM